MTARALALARRIPSAARIIFLAGASVALACTDEAPPAGSADAGTATDAATPPVEDAAKAKDAAVPVIDVECPIDATVEFEPNDTPDTATVVDSLSSCGAITPGTDEDYSTFTTPAGKKLTLFQAVIDGAVDFELRVAGKTLRPDEVSEFVPGQYVVRAFTTDHAPGRYQYRIQFEP